MAETRGWPVRVVGVAFTLLAVGAVALFLSAMSESCGGGGQEVVELCSLTPLALAAYLASLARAYVPRAVDHRAKIAPMVFEIVWAFFLSVAGTVVSAEYGARSGEHPGAWLLTGAAGMVLLAVGHGLYARGRDGRRVHGIAFVAFAILVAQLTWEVDAYRYPTLVPVVGGAVSLALASVGVVLAVRRGSS